MHYSFVHSRVMDGPTFFDAVLTKRGVNPTSLAAAIKRPTAQSGFDRFRKGLIRQPKRSDALERAAKFLGVDVLAFYDKGLAEREWARISGDQPQSDAPTEIPLDANPDYPAIRRVRFKLSAGASGFGVEYLQGEGAPIVFQREWFTSRGYKPARLFAVRVANGSMEPGLYDGDTVVVNTDDTQPKDGAVFAVNYEGELVVKRLLRDAGQWWLASDNPNQAAYPRKVCDERSIILGRIVHKQTERI